MEIRYGALQEPKPGAKADQCEDALAYSDTRGLVAVSDGASNAFESRLWARLLAQGFVADSPLGFGDDGLLSWTDSVAYRWSEAIPWQALSVFQKAKAREGSASTLVGLELTTSSRRPTAGTWRCLALGDSCLFQVSGDRLAEKLPVSRSADFGLHTPLLYTERDSNRQNIPAAVRWHGTWQQGDCFFLLTDAIAQWFLREDERGAAPWKTLISLDEAGFSAFVKEKRARHQMRQDDVTAFMVGLGVPLAARRTPTPVEVQPSRQQAIEPIGAVEPDGRAELTASPSPGRQRAGPVPVGAGPPGATAGIDDPYLPAGPPQTHDHYGAGEAGQGTEWDDAAPSWRRRAAVVGACVLILALAIGISRLGFGGSAPSPPAPPVPAVQTAAKDLADLLTTYQGGDAASYQAYEAKLASHVLHGNPVVMTQLTGSGSAPPFLFTSQTKGVTVAVVRSTGSQAELYLVVDQAITIPSGDRGATQDTSRRLLIHLTMARQGQQWLVSSAQVRPVAGQATGALVLPASTS